MEKTDLKQILSISGETGLFQYVSQGRNCLIAESLITKQRKPFGSSARVSSLADISIYTNDKEVSLKDVLKNMAAILNNGPAMSSKEDVKKIKAFFSEAIPNYDEDRFYASHMKKVLDWYNVLQQYASLDFAEYEEEQSEEKAE